MIKKIDFVTLSPLFLLTLLPVGSLLYPFFTGTAANPEIAFHRYFSIPLIGFGFGLFFFLGVIRKGWGLPSFLSNLLKERLTTIVVAVTTIFIVFFSGLSVLRYISFHTTINDLGVYDNKVWRIAEALPSIRGVIISLTGHFQPILMVHALLYKIYASPMVLLILQVITVASGVIPLYLLAKNFLKESIGALIIVLLYFLYPATEFNSIADFHPDHIYIPAVLWAFYFAHKGKYITSIIMIGIGGLAKEPLLLGGSFFGIYLAIKHKRYFTGIITALFFLLLFVVIFFYVQPALNYLPGEEKVPLLKDASYSYIFNFFNSSRLFFEGLFKGVMRKLLFIYFLLFPFLFLPFFRWKELIPAIPPITIQLLSTTALHYSPESQYTAGIISPIIFAFLAFVNKIQKNIGERYVNAMLIMVLIMMLTANIVRSPSPLSINFWSSKWSENWNYTNCTSGKHEEMLREVLRIIPTDKEVVVMSQNNINHERLAHRYNYFAFPHNWERVDYILLDSTRPLMVGDKIDKAKYMEDLRKIRDSHAFEQIFDKDGIMLFKKMTNI